MGSTLSLTPSHPDALTEPFCCCDFALAKVTYNFVVTHGLSLFLSLSLSLSGCTLSLIPSHLDALTEPFCCDFALAKVTYNFVVTHVLSLFLSLPFSGSTDTESP